MRRLARRPFTLCSAVSLLLCVAVCVLWLLSYRMDRTYRFPPVAPPAAEAAPLPGRPAKWRYQWHVSMGGGSFQVKRKHSFVPRPGWGLPLGLTNDAPIQFPFHGKLATATYLHAAGFQYFHLDRAHGAAGGSRYWRAGIRYVTVPGWSPALVIGLPSALWLLRRGRLARRAGVGLCPSCGYDLRASPERCPECGTAAAAGR